MHVQNLVLVNDTTFYIFAPTVHGYSKIKLVLGSFYRTLTPIYKNFHDSSLGFGFYNDKKPDGFYSYDHGHTKGAFEFDSKEGFWLIHSVPKFPNFVNNGYSYPHSGTVYGQSMLCVTLTLDQFDIVGKHFQYTYPQYYNVSIPEGLQSRVPNLVTSAVNNQHVTEPPYINNFSIFSEGIY